jgi:hypothetical protein
MTKMIQLFAKLGFKENYFDEAGIASNFKKRTRKLKCFDYISALILNASNKVMSYNTLASSIADDNCKAVSKQALQKAMVKDEFLNCLETVYKDVLLSKLNLNCDKLKTRYKRIIIQDSTIIKLPKRLFERFSGVCNGFVQVANARIQLAINVLSNDFVHFALNGYSTNDVKAAAQLVIQAGDLILRDRGYFTIAEIKRMLKVKASFIYRYKHGIHYCNVETGVPIDLLKKLSKTKETCLKVKLCDKNGPTVRLIAMPIKNELADTRRAKLKKEAKNYPKDEVLALLSWSIFITSIEVEDMHYTEVFELYKLRWRIEIVFKTMKTHLSLDHIHNVSENQLKFIVLSKVLLLVLILQFVYEMLINPIKELFGRTLSLLKLARFLIDRKNVLNDLIICAGRIKECQELKLLAKYCTYDKRHRNNFNYQFQQCPLS